MLYKSLAIILATLPCIHGGVTATVSSSDLASSPGFGNLKATYDTDLTLAGSKAKLSILYAASLRPFASVRCARAH